MVPMHGGQQIVVLDQECHTLGFGIQNTHIQAEFQCPEIDAKLSLEAAETFNKFCLLHFNLS